MKIIKQTGKIMVVVLIIAVLTIPISAFAATLKRGNDFWYSTGNVSGETFAVDGNTAYCVNPLQPIPGNGNYTPTQLNNDSLMKVLYYGYGGIGFNNTIKAKMDSYHNNQNINVTGKDLYYGLTRRCAAKAYGSNYKFSYYADWNNAIDNFYAYVQALPNPNKRDREKFTKAEIDRLWKTSDDKYYQIVLMLIYSGVRISEMLNLKREDVNLNEQYFDVKLSKTENGIRRVPIADKVLPFFTNWYNDGESEYLLHTENGNKFDYRNYYDSYFTPLMVNLNMDHTPHCTRHTCISMLAEAQVDQTTIKKIVGHSGAMTMTERVYTHLDVEVLINAINKI